MLTGVYWERSGWKEFKSDVLLVTLLSNYADYLVKQCDGMKRVHSSQQPVCQISKNLSFGYLPLCEALTNLSKPPCLPPEIFFKYIIFQILFQHLMGITSHSLTRMVQKQPKPTAPHWQNWENQNSSFCCQCSAFTQCITYDPM